MTNRMLTLPLAVTFALALGACEKKQETSSAPTPTVEPTPAATAAASTASAAPAASAGESVTVAKGGTEFDPPEAIGRMPDGAWVCNMGGKVHYASMDKGKGECPKCGMKLTQHRH